MESNVEALRRRNDAAAAKELAELRADTIKGLRHAFRQGGERAIRALMNDAGLYIDQYGVIRDSSHEREALARTEPGDECPLCQSGTVEHVDGEVRCRGECGSVVRAGRST